MVGSNPRVIGVDGKKIEERSDLLRSNGGIFTGQGEAIGELAQEDAKNLVVGNPAKTNALIGRTKSNNPTQSWFAMTALDAHSTNAQLAKKARVEKTSVSNIPIWGNQRPT